MRQGYALKTQENPRPKRNAGDQVRSKCRTWVSDDAVGAALDELYDANHEALITDVVVAMAREFGVRLDELHADTTSVSFSGQYPDQAGMSIRGRRPPFITRGFSKDHRPDLKQLLLKLTTSSDGDVPVQFRVGA